MLDAARKDSFRPVETLADRIKYIRKTAGMSQEKFAAEIGVSRGAVGNWELGEGISTEKLREIAEKFEVSLDWLGNSRGPAPAIVKAIHTPQNAELLGPVPMGSWIPLYGQASAGKDGEFPWNGEQIQPVLAPPALNGVRGAYAVLVAGDSMIPKYRSGDTVFVHPHRPAHRGDYVVVQIQGDEGQPPLAYVKRFVSLDLRTLRLEQLNPKKVLTFQAKRVRTIDRIVGNEEG